MYLGIDFGTTYSTIAIYVDNEQKAGLLPALTESDGFPTLMRYDPAGFWLYGKETDIEHYPNDTIQGLKAKIRNSKTIKGSAKTGGREVTFEEMLRGYLAWLLRQGLDRARGSDNHIIADEDIDGITVTVPCGFTGSGQTHASYGQALKENAEAAANDVAKSYEEIIRNGIKLAGRGNPVVYVREEPVAAAIDYLHNSEGRMALAYKSDLTILVADLGGGTFDVTVVKCKGKDRFQIGTKEGDMHLGGNDFDDALLQLWVSKIKGKNPAYTLTPDKRRLNLLRATKVKELLSEKKLSGEVKDTTVTFMGEGGEEARVTRQEFEDATRALLQRAMDLIRRCVDQNGGIGAIDKIVLVGGGCRMPQIKNGIKRMYSNFGESNIVLHDPSYSIANGAAYCALMGDVIVETIDDIATCTYGFYASAGEDHPHIRNMILKGTSFTGDRIAPPLLKNYRALKSTQLAVCFQVFESTATEETVPVNKNNVKWVNGKFELNDGRFNSTGLEVRVPIPREYQGKADKYLLDVEMMLDRNGELWLAIYHNDQYVGGNHVRRQSR